MSEMQTCKNCGNIFSGKYCNNCGEKLYREKDKSVKHFIGEAFHFISHLDSKYFKTLFLVFRRPGKVSLDYSNGIRSPYYKPVALFLIGVILYLIFPFFQGLNLKFWGNMVTLKHEGLGFITALADKKAAARHISMEQLAELYDHKSPAFAKILILVIIPLTALALRLMFRKKKTYFFDHLVLATETSSFFLYFVFFLLPLMVLLPGLVAKWMGYDPRAIFTDIITIPISLFVILLWAAAAFRRFYAITKWRSFFKALLFLLLHSLIVFIIYRVILFLTVLLFI